MNRFERSAAAQHELRKLEFAEDRGEQEEAALSILRFDHDYGLSDTERAVFDFLLAEIRQKLDDVVDLQALKNERRFWLKPPLDNGQ